MTDNPFSELINLFRKDADMRASPVWRIGTVRPDLSIEVAGLGIARERIKIADKLELKQGDRLVMLPYDDAQRWIIICKVVAL